MAENDLGFCGGALRSVFMVGLTAEGQWLDAVAMVEREISYGRRKREVG